MPAANRTREARRVEVARLHLRGQSQAEIARTLGCSPAQVSRDLRALRPDWLASSDRNYKDQRAEVLAELEELKRDYRQGWEQSCKQREISLTRRREEPNQLGEASLRREPGRLNPAFLNGVGRCIDRQTRLLGLEYGEHYDESNMREPHISPDGDYLDTEFNRLLERCFPPKSPGPQPGDRLPRGFSMPEYGEPVLEEPCPSDWTQPSAVPVLNR